MAEPSAAKAIRGRALLAVSMLLAVLAVAALARWDSDRESASALADFAHAQAALAESAAGELATRLDQESSRALAARASARRGAEAGDKPVPDERGDDEEGRDEGAPVDDALVARALSGLAHDEQPGDTVVLLLPPPTEPQSGRAKPAPRQAPSPRPRALLTPQGQAVRSEKIEAALRALAGPAEPAQPRTVRLERADAVAIGLPLRLAYAGLARIERPEGSYGVAVASTALRERDRERRAGWRLAWSIALAAALTFAFGGLALRAERRRDQERHRAELQRVSDERLATSSRAATTLTMASGMAHELGTPLSVILGRAEQLLVRDNLDERERRAAQAIADQAQGIGAVVRGFLELARGRAPVLREVSPRQLAASALALVEHRFAQAGVALASQVTVELPPIAGEPRLLEHALVNLLLNACDACERGGHVALSASLESASVRFEVRDDGSGISPADAARITEPFFTTKPPGKGSGLGLAIVSEIAKSHRGALALEPAPPRGTRASLTIPLAAP